MGAYDKAREKTRQKIMAAFWDIFETDTIHQITVKKITNNCNIHRATFYLYYEDVYEVLQEIEEMLLNELDTIRAENLELDTAGFNAYATLVFNVLRKDQKYLRRLVIQAADPEFSVRYKEKLIEILLSIFTEQNLTEKSRMTLKIVNTASVDIILAMADSGFYTVEEIIRLVKGIMLKGVFPTIKDYYHLIPVEADIFME